MTSRRYHPIIAGIALFLGTFLALNVAGGMFVAGFDAHHWLLGLDALPAPLASLLLALGAVTLLAIAVGPVMAARWRATSLVVVMALMLIAAVNTAGYFALIARATIRSAMPLPLSLLVFVALGTIAVAIIRQNSASLIPRPAMTRRFRRGLFILAVAGVCAIGFAVSQMYFFGKTDYRRPVDAIVVFGARAYADGRPSHALADRVRTACALYHQGLATRLIFSGGPGDGDIDEPAAMRRMAISLGVPATAILTDSLGLNTQATVEQTTVLCQRHGLQRVMAVSHFYHLPRVKMTYQRAGWEVYTVPAREAYTLTQMPWLITREVAAWWVYYLRPMTG